MPQFSALVEEQLRGPTVRLTPIVLFDFRSGPLGLWPGTGPLEIDDTIYHGISDLGRMSAVSSGPGGVVEEMTLELFASSSMIRTMKADSAESVGRECVAKFQFFDVREFDHAGNYVAWDLIDEPFEYFWGRMGPLILNRAVVQPGEQPTRILSVNVQNALINRSRAATSYFSNRDQLARYPTDNIFIRTAQMASTTVKWPNFP